MNAEEAQIWKQHQSRLAEISKEKEKLWKGFYNNVNATRASLSNQPALLKVELEKLSKTVSEQNKIIEKKESTEISRYINEIKEYDRLKFKNSEQEHQQKEVKKDELTQEEIKEIARRQLMYELKQRDSRETERER